MFCFLACSYRLIHLPQPSKQFKTATTRAIPWHSMECSTATPITTTAATETATAAAVVTTDPYELKLFQMFQCCDTKRCGYLDEFSLRRLCSMLELHQKGAVLIDNLTAKDKLSHVTFENFKEELLNFLGADLNDQLTIEQHDIEQNCNNTTTATMENHNAHIKQQNYRKQNNEHFHILDEVVDHDSVVNNENKAEQIDDNRSQRLVRDDENNSEREISPKLIMGTKKYGRRSRPIIHRIADDDNLLTTSDSDSELSADEIIPIRTSATKTTTAAATSKTPHHSKLDAQSHRNCSLSTFVQRSCSQSDIPNDSSGGRGCGDIGAERTTYGTKAKYKGCKLKRCASLPAQKSIQNTKISLWNGGTNKTSHLSVGDTQLIKLEKQQISSSLESLGTPVLEESLPRQKILELWEMAHVANGNGILTALGFNEDEDDHINLAQLMKIMEDEMYSSLDDEPQVSLMKACLVLQSAELRALRQSARQLCEENNKLQADNKDSNRRIALFTAEIDEIHASIEDATKKEIRLLEAKHSEQIKELTQRLSNEHEFWTGLNSRLESRIKEFEQNEMKLKVELEFIQSENQELLDEQHRMRQQIGEFEKRNSQLNIELNALKRCEEDQTTKDAKHLNNDEHFDAKNTQDMELINLVAKVSTLQLDNTNLRDKNDELVAEIEALHLELNKMKLKMKNRKWDGEMESLRIKQDELEQEADSPKQLVMMLSPSANENSDISCEWLTALNSELNYNEKDIPMERSEQQKQQKELHETKEREIETLKNQVKELKLQLELQDQKEYAKENEVSKSNETSKAAASSSSPSPSPTPDERCHQLELSLEQMQHAYEDCEDYWQTKLTEERALFEKERLIYEEEQQENDKKFTELMEKVREYEEQFNKDGRLTPIEEKDQLEQQYVDLEMETLELKRTMEKCMEESAQEIERLKLNIVELQAKLKEQTERNESDINVLRINIRKNSKEEILDEGANKENYHDNKNASVTTNFIESTITTTTITATPISTTTINSEEMKSVANITTSYLWQQPKVKNCESIEEIFPSLSAMPVFESNNTLRNNNLSTSEISKFSTPPPEIEKPLHDSGGGSSACGNGDMDNKVQSIPSETGDVADCESSSTTSSKQSFETHTIHVMRNEEQQQHLQGVQQQHGKMLNKSSSSSTSNNSRKTYSPSPSHSSPSHGPPNGLKDELKRLKYFEIKLREQIKNLSMQRDGLIMELQQLHDAKPVLEKAYARTAHPSLIQRVNQLELRNRHLQNVIKQQQQYNESYMQQSWRQHQIELNELHGRLETQSALIAEQVQRLQSADILVKDLYVENSHLAAAVQRLEQQRIRINFIQQQQQQQQQQLHHQQHLQPRTTTTSCSGFTGNALN